MSSSLVPCLDSLHVAGCQWLLLLLQALAAAAPAEDVVSMLSPFVMWLLLLQLSFGSCFCVCFCFDCCWCCCPLVLWLLLLLLLWRFAAVAAPAAAFGTGCCGFCLCDFWCFCCCCCRFCHLVGDAAAWPSVLLSWLLLVLTAAVDVCGVCCRMLAFHLLVLPVRTS